MSKETYFNTRSHIVAKMHNTIFVNVLLDYPVWGELDCRVMLVVKYITKTPLYAPGQKTFWFEDSNQS